jgi:hypothetical protein
MPETGAAGGSRKAAIRKGREQHDGLAAFLALIGTIASDRSGGSVHPFVVSVRRLVARLVAGLSPAAVHWGVKACHPSAPAAG